jgi:hypothetical protein
MAPIETPRPILWPRDVERRYGITDDTRRAWERRQRIPVRDVHIAGRPEGWYLTTIENAERGHVSHASTTQAA